MDRLKESRFRLRPCGGAQSIQRLDDSFVEGTEEEYDTGEIEELEEDNNRRR